MSTSGTAAPGDGDLASLERAILGLETQREALGDAVVETALAPLRTRRDQLLQGVRGEQRRLVTVVFADLVGSTELAARLDPEDLRALLDTYFSRWSAVIAEHGGEVEKFIGDAVMAVFGLRRSFEDDAARAVRASLAVLASLEDLDGSFEREHGVRLQVRVGIDTGEVVASTLGDRGADFVVVGPTVNRAARLEAAAPVDSILISEETRRLVRGGFSMERRDQLVLKGFDVAVTAYRVVSERPRSARLDRSGGVEGVDTTTVGREIELRYLQERFLDVVEESAYRVVTVVGDAGVGKSRLLLELDSWFAERREPVWWFSGRAAQVTRHHPFALVRDLVTGRCDIAATDPPEVALAKLETGIATAYDVPAAARDAARLLGTWLGLAPAPEDPTPELRDRGTGALADLLVRVSRTAPVVVLLEDLHWADEASLAWFDTAAPLLAGAPVLVVATTRPTLLEDRPHWGEGLDHHLRLPLSPLSRREGRLLLAQLLQRVVDPPAALLDLVIDSAEGNPFYLEELVTWLVDSGVLVKGAETWRVEPGRMGSVVVPSTLRGVLQARLDALAPPERALLQRASVIGRVFWDEAVERLSDSPAPVTDGLESLRAAGVVSERERSAITGAREFVFKHALLRDVAYESVLRAHRRHHHRAAGRWLAEVGARTGRVDEHAALVADHLDRAGDPDAAGWYLRAARRASTVYALDDALALLAKALELAPPATAVDLRCEALLLRESVLDRLGDRDAQVLDLDELERLLPGRGDPAQRAAYQLARSRLAFTTSRYDEATGWAERAVATADEAGLPAVAADAQLWRGKALTWQDRTDQAGRQLDEALARARAEALPRLEAETLRYLSMLANNEGDFGAAVDLAGRSARVFADAGDPEGEATARTQGAAALFNAERFDEAQAAFEDVLPVFRRSGHRGRVTTTLLNLAVVAHSRTRLAQARAWALEAEQDNAVLGDAEALVNARVLLGMVAAAVGRVEEAEGWLESGRQVARDVGSRAGEMETWVWAAVAHLEAGRAVAALVPARAAAALREELHSARDRGLAALVLGYAELEGGDPRVAEQALEDAEACLAEAGTDALAQEARVARAGVLLRQGDAAAGVPLVEPLLGLLPDTGLQGVVRPAAVLQTGWQVLRAAGDPRADQLLTLARAWLTGSAERIGDDALAAGYLALPSTAALLGESPGTSGVA